RRSAYRRAHSIPQSLAKSRASHRGGTLGNLRSGDLGFSHPYPRIFIRAAPGGEAIARCVLAGFADQVARRRSGGTLLCDIVHGRRGQLARSSVAQNSRLIVAAEITEIEGRSGEAQVLLSLATQIEERWLREMFPNDFEERVAHHFDRSQNRVVVRRERVFRDLVIDSQDRDAEPSAEASACLAAAVAAGDL